MVTGYTFAEYIRNRRLYLAAREMQETDLKVIDAAVKYGYESPDAFARAFRRFHGFAPSQLGNIPVMCGCFCRYRSRSRSGEVMTCTVRFETYRGLR